jgi:crotonobetainyl-CoA:carnitine CoA-transferase CaiB-like acyl-CoA transferase
MKLPGIDDLVVIEAAEGIAAPFCGMFLADLGARVIKIEPLDGDWSRSVGPPHIAGNSAPFLAMNRNKESVSVDLRDPRGLDAVRRLAARSDVFVQGYRPGAMDRLGLGEAELLALNDRLIYCSLSAYGNRGPKRERPGTDTVIQGYSGIMSITGEADGPPARVGTAVADTAAGIYAVISVMSMLLQRSHTGKGGRCDTSLLEAMLHLQSVSFESYFAGGAPQRLGSRSDLSAVPAEAVETADGFITLSCHGARQWRRLCEALGRSEWIDDPISASNNDRVEHYDEVIGRLRIELAKRTTAEWMDTFERTGVNAGIVQTLPEVAADEQVTALGIVESYDSARYGELRMIGLPIAIGREPKPTLDIRDPPLLGEHSQAVLEEIGIAPDVAAAWIDEGVFGVPRVSTSS